MKTKYYIVYRERSDGCYPMYEGDIDHCRAYIINHCKAINVNPPHNYFIGKLIPSCNLAGNCRRFIEIKQYNEFI